jgi:recombination protein RecT
MKSPAFAEQVGRVLPTHMTADRMMRVALTCLTRTPKLGQCTQASVVKCLLDCATLGLEPDGRRAHLIPYKDQCTLIIDYKGLVELVRRAGDVSRIHADTICENDEFEYDLGEIKAHRVNYRKPRGDVYAAYAMVTMKDGTTQAAVMTRDEIEAIRKRSMAGGDGPWVTDWNEMAKKTVFRRLCKWLTLSPEIRDAIEIDDRHADIVETTATRIEQPVSSTARVMAMLSTPDAPPAPQETPKPEADGIDTGRGEEPQIEPQAAGSRSMEVAKQLIRDAKTIAAVDAIIGGEAESGDHTAEELNQLEAFGDTRKRQIHIETAARKA